jgi:type IV pilus assembly protein PilC
MPKFFYVAKNQAGETKNGEIEAADERNVVEQMKKEGFWITSLKEIKEKKKNTTSFLDNFVRVPLKSKMIFCRHLGVMISSGLSLSRALTILANQEKNASFKTIINKVGVDVKGGVAMADAMEKFPAVFDSVFISMVRVGEVSGNLEEILGILSDQMEKDHKLVSKVRGAMIYPGVIFTVMVLLGILLMMFVVPKITQLFKDFGTELPLATRILVSISDFMASHVFSTFFILIAAVVGIRMFAKTLSGKKLFHKFFLKGPVVGGIVTKVNSARFARILSSLMGSGVALVEALKITADTLGNYYFKSAITQCSKDVQKGIPLSQVLKKYDDIFPYLVVQMVEVGEETGRTDQVLKKVAGFFEEEVDQITKNMSSIIEPVLMVVIGAAVMVFAIAIIQPIYGIMGSM